MFIKTRDLWYTFCKVVSACMFLLMLLISSRLCTDRIELYFTVNVIVTVIDRHNLLHDVKFYKVVF